MAQESIEKGDIVVLSKDGLAQARRMYPHLSSGTQFRVTHPAVSGYHRKAMAILERPNANPIVLWRAQLKRLPSGARVSDVWVKSGMAQWIP